MKRSPFWLALSVILLAHPHTGAATDNAVAFVYHQFGRDDVPQTSVPLAAFEAQLSFLAENNFTVLPLSEIVSRFQNRQEVPPDTVAITIDDAYATIYEHAYPRLRKLGWPFTVFVSTDSVDENSKLLMSWDQMREMANHGAEFANHSASHGYLARTDSEPMKAWEVRVRNDIVRAQTRLREELGTTLSLFAYPYGEYSEALVEIVDDLKLIGVGQQSGAFSSNSDFRLLPRFAINETYSSIEQFAVKARALSMPVRRSIPFDPVITGNTIPTLEIQLEGVIEDWRGLKCFISGQDSPAIIWINEAPPTFRVSALKPLPLGRSRFNCTAPSDKQGRYFWFSQLWLRR